MPPLNNFQKSCVALAIGQALTLQSASAATITVNGTGAGDCTLRDAIVSANDNVATRNCDTGEDGLLDTINLPPITFSYDDYYVDTYCGDYCMLPTIASDITLQGDTNGGTTVLSVI